MNIIPNEEPVAILLQAYRRKAVLKLGRKEIGRNRQFDGLEVERGIACAVLAH